MLIKPGTHTLRVRYWIKDYTTGTEGTITKNLGSFVYDKNTFYDMTANLDVRNYPANDYYMWDAQKLYWDGHEWDSAAPWQPTVNGQTDGRYPQNNGDPRWYNEVAPGTAATHTCAITPNVNELTWYVMKGDGHWDADELWTTMGHLYKGGMWLLKKANITGFSTEKAWDGIDHRPGLSNINSPATTGQPSASVISKYFYLPALGQYLWGQLKNVGINGYYWGATAGKWNGNTYNLGFGASGLEIYDNSRFCGFKVWAFQ